MNIVDKRAGMLELTKTIDDIALEGADGHRWQLVGCGPAAPRAVLLWLPAMGVAARHYLPLAEALANHEALLDGEVALLRRRLLCLGRSPALSGGHSPWGQGRV